ncbi:hypothetical protein [Thalassobellus suaedae]|uniref:J domain-containing protein n=1 Tax=Thalassobellus suaedae TaxID=3074124 RepID=A0ABY9XVL5_9FLAO|nr:hypothetical protein RHP51_04125 [Flavobacteriaceae bacterium HL-DH14]
MKYLIIQSDNVESINEGLFAYTLFQSSIWFWIAWIECVLLIILIIKLKKRHKKLQFSVLSKSELKHSQKTTVDMENVMNSINGARGLYKDLSKQCHPDKFINTEYQETSAEIFKELSRHKRNYNKLSELRERAIIELNINI